MFIDIVKITIRSGKGGDGMSAFRREKYVPKGGPSGGNGGRGGDVYFVGDEGLSTLLEFRYNRLLKAEDGEAGKNKKMQGKDGENLFLKVPVGTTVFNARTGKVLADITANDQKALILKGGRGGRGNAVFASSRNTAPDYAEKGEPGKELDLQIELKLLADVGIIGMPNAGKSTLISVISAARPKIASYPFTTIVPNLGVVGTDDGRSFVAADMPGLIEGASRGQGLGQQFLRHIERTRVLVHVVDMSAFEGRDPYEDCKTINDELAAYGHKLEKRPQVIVANKMDMPEAESNLERFRRLYKGDHPIIPISSVTKKNIKKLVYLVADELAETKKKALYEPDAFAPYVEYTFNGEKEPFTIRRGDDGILEVEGEGIEKLFAMTDFAKHEGVRRFARRLKELGVEAELKKLGAETGDTVRILGEEFDFSE